MNLEKLQQTKLELEQYYDQLSNEIQKLSDEKLRVEGQYTFVNSQITDMTDQDVKKQKKLNKEAKKSKK